LTQRILELAEELSPSCRHLNGYFKNRQWDVVCEALPGRSAEDLLTWLPFVQENAVALRFQPEGSDTVVKQFPQLPTNVRWLETADTLLLEDGAWWPRLLSYDAFRKLLISRFPALNVGLHCYVIGATQIGRVGVASMASLGFSHLSVVDEDELKLHREVAFLKRYLLGIQIESVPASTLTVQTKAGALMLNTLHLPEENPVLKDLSYFNFMNQGGVVVDISECCHDNALLQEAQRADLSVLTGLEVQSQIDVDLLTKLFPDKYVTYEDYFESFEAFMAAPPAPAVGDEGGAGAGSAEGAGTPVS
jgi:shikimate 5-dehydrogenase